MTANAERRTARTRRLSAPNTRTCPTTQPPAHCHPDLDRYLHHTVLNKDYATVRRRLPAPTQLDYAPPIPCSVNNPVNDRNSPSTPQHAAVYAPGRDGPASQRATGIPPARTPRRLDAPRNLSRDDACDKNQDSTGPICNFLIALPTTYCHSGRIASLMFYDPPHRLQCPKASRQAPHLQITATAEPAPTTPPAAPTIYRPL
ncbi:hypothetical protein CesoFtcFv8_020850 [Champsocephalus esox]|nr:hypothetical protein CesoFtcFv8_020850 [Champsocephalus esox]